MAFSLRLLRVFLAVARRSSFTRAAGELGLTQPAVSRAVRELELQVGATLLERTPAGVRLTQAGEALLVHARVIFAEARTAEEDLQALAGLTQGTLRLGSSPTIATYLLPPLAQAFNTRHPGVELRLTSGPSRAIGRLLVEREVDVALVETPVADARLTTTVWAHDDLVVIVGAEHPLASRGPVAPAALAHELLVIREPGSGTYDTVLRALRAHGVVPQRRLEVDSVEAITQLVAAGLGFAIISRCAAADALALRRLAIVEVSGLRISRPLMRLSLTASEESAAARAFGRLLGSPGPTPGAANGTSRAPATETPVGRRRRPTRR